MKRILSRAFCILGVSMLVSGCATFALSYQNYFTKNFAYVASKYDGDPSRQLSDGAESNNFEDGNLAEYGLNEYPTLIFGFRSLEHHNSRYTSGSGMNETIVGSFIPPGKKDPVVFVNVNLTGSAINVAPAIPEAKNIQMIKQTYPAIMVMMDHAALQKTYGQGTYTIVWKSLKANGKAEDRMLSQVVTKLVP